MVELEILQTARDLLARHGDRAIFVAAAHTNELIDQDDVEGFRLWSRIANAIGKLMEERQAQAFAPHS